MTLEQVSLAWFVCGFIWGIDFLLVLDLLLLMTKNSIHNTNQVDVENHGNVPCPSRRECHICRDLRRQTTKKEDPFKPLVQSNPSEETTEVNNHNEDEKDDNYDEDPYGQVIRDENALKPRPVPVE